MLGSVEDWWMGVCACVRERVCVCAHLRHWWPRKPQAFAVLNYVLQRVGVYSISHLSVAAPVRPHKILWLCCKTASTVKDVNLLYTQTHIHTHRVRERVRTDERKSKLAEPGHCFLSLWPSFSVSYRFICLFLLLKLAWQGKDFSKILKVYPQVVEKSHRNSSEIRWNPWNVATLSLSHRTGVVAMA